MGWGWIVSGYTGDTFSEMETIHFDMDDPLYRDSLAEVIWRAPEGFVYPQGAIVDQFLGEYARGRFCVSLRRNVQD